MVVRIPNMHHKIQAIDKARERSKDEMKLIKKSSYVKIYDINFTKFIKFLNLRRKRYIFQMVNQILL